MQLPAVIIVIESLRAWSNLFYDTFFICTDSSSDADNDSDDDASDNEEEEGSNSGLIDAVRADKGDFFGYIDETGNVVYINMNDEGEGEEGGMEVTDGAAVTAGNVCALFSFLTVSRIFAVLSWIYAFVSEA